MASAKEMAAARFEARERAVLAEIWKRHQEEKRLRPPVGLVPRTEPGEGHGPSEAAVPDALRDQARKVAEEEARLLSIWERRQRDTDRRPPSLMPTPAKDPLDRELHGIFDRMHGSGAGVPMAPMPGSRPTMPQGLPDRLGSGNTLQWPMRDLLYRPRPSEPLPLNDLVYRPGQTPGRAMLVNSESTDGGVGDRRSGSPPWALSFAGSALRPEPSGPTSSEADLQLSQLRLPAPPIIFAPPLPPTPPGQPDYLQTGGALWQAFLSLLTSQLNSDRDPREEPPESAPTPLVPQTDTETNEREDEVDYEERISNEFGDAPPNMPQMPRPTLVNGQEIFNPITGNPMIDIDGRAIPPGAPDRVIVGWANGLESTERRLTPDQHSRLSFDLFGSSPISAFPGQKEPIRTRDGNVYYVNVMPDGRIGLLLTVPGQGNRVYYNIIAVPDRLNPQGGRVIAHEIGHGVDEMTGDQITGIAFPIDENMRGELQENYRLLNGGRLPTAYGYSETETFRNGRTKSDSELIAEGFRAYFENPNYFKSVAPSAAAAMRAAVNPVIGDRLLLMENEYPEPFTGNEFNGVG